jgi:large subunit ribosomal protein L31
MSSTKPTRVSKPAKDKFVKKDIHPQLKNVSFVDVSTGKKFLTKSTVGSKKIETINGEEFHVLVRDVTMDSHPAYTGEKRFVDTAGRVEKFQSKFSRKK